MIIENERHPCRAAKRNKAFRDTPDDGDIVMFRAKLQKVRTTF